MRLFKTILLLFLIAGVTIFIIQNMEIVKLSFLNFHLEIPLSFTTVAVYILGAISGSLIFSLLRKLTIENTGKKN